MIKGQKIILGEDLDDPGLIALDCKIIAATTVHWYTAFLFIVSATEYFTFVFYFGLSQL